MVNAASRSWSTSFPIDPPTISKLGASVNPGLRRLDPATTGLLDSDAMTRHVTDFRDVRGHHAGRVPVEFHPVRSLRTFEEAIEQIAYAIRVGDLAVGDRLPPERTLAATMQISRPTLREAIHLLVRTNVLEVRPGQSGGTFVISDTVPNGLLQTRIHSHIHAVAEVLEARRALEPEVAQIAGVYATQVDFDRLETTISEQWRALNHRDRLLQLEERFHLQIARATGNHMLVELMKTLHGRLAIAWDIGKRLPKDDEHGIRLHEETLAALKSRDPRKIAEVMDRHLALLEHLWADETGRPRLREPNATPARRSSAAS